MCLSVFLSSRIFSWSDLLRTSLLAFKYYYGFAFISISLYNHFCDELMIDFFFFTIALITNNYIPVTFSLLSFHVISSEISAFNKEFYLHRTSRWIFFKLLNHVIFLHPLYIVLISIHRLKGSSRAVFPYSFNNRLFKRVFEIILSLP